MARNIIIILLVLILVILLCTLFFVYNMYIGEEGFADTILSVFSKDSIEMYSESIDIITNLKNKGNNRSNYIKLSIVCGSTNEKTIESLNTNIDKLKDLYIVQLKTLFYEELQDEGVSIIKGKFTEAINEEFGIEDINIYITDLIIQ